MNLEGLEISFRLLGDTSRLNGHIKVEHKDCGENKFCGETFDFRSIGNGNLITIQTALDPCINHTRIQIKASKYESEGGGLFFWTRNLAASDCKDPLDTDTEAVTSSSQHENNKTKNFFTANQFQNSIILGVALLVIIVLAVTLAAEAQKPKTFRIAAFYAQNFSGRSARIQFSRHIKKAGETLLRHIKKVRNPLSRHIKKARNPLSRHIQS